MPHRSRATVLQTIKSLSPSLRTQHVVAMARKIHQRDQQGEIAALSFLFNLSLPNPGSFNETNIRNFDIANTFTWVSYSLFDDIIDHPKNIRLAHTAAILSSVSILKMKALSSYSASTIATSVALELFTETDTAIHTEVTTCRATISNGSITIPHIPKTNHLKVLLASKSIAHITGPAIITKHLYPLQYEMVIKTLRSYCAMRQLLDDLYDWEEDLRDGHITLVTATLLRKHGAPEESVWPFSTLIPELRRIFWESVAEELCNTIVETVTKNIASLATTLSIPPNSPFITATLIPIHKSATSTIQSIHHQKQLLNTLRRKQR